LGSFLGGLLKIYRLEKIPFHKNGVKINFLAWFCAFFNQCKIQENMKVILATDGTKQSEAAIEITKKLNLKPGDEIRVISVVDMALPLSVDIYAGYQPSTEEIENAVKENAEKILAMTGNKLQEIFGNQNINIMTELLNGSPESRIVEKAEETNADLIIVGSHGYNRWERLLLGSVSDSVIHHAPCSVLVVRSK
jgi:nucleotide-binding universal stress UspA family protein